METLSNGDVRLEFDAEHGGRIAQIWHSENPILIDAADADDPIFGWGCNPMVPWAGRLAAGRFQFRRDVVQMPINAGRHAIHGTGALNSWTIAAASRSSLVARLNLEVTGWPFASWCEQRVSLGPDSLHLELSVHGDVREFPAQVGWHPWFKVPDSCVMTFGTMFARDEDHLPTNRTVPPHTGPWDDCFTDLVDGPRLMIDGVAIDLSSSCRYWVIYNQSPNGWCLEPQSGLPNAFNSAPESALDIVGPARVLQHHFTMHFS